MMISYPELLKVSSQVLPVLLMGKSFPDPDDKQTVVDESIEYASLLIDRTKQASRQPSETASVEDENPVFSEGEPYFFPRLMHGYFCAQREIFQPAGVHLERVRMRLAFRNDEKCNEACQTLNMICRYV